MAKLTLSLAFHANPRSGPVLDGTVQPDGIEFVSTHVSPAELFYRQLHHQEFDVSEMSLSSLAIVAAQGNSPWIALPVFTTRTFFGIGAFVRKGAGIERPEDLKGKRVGANEYQITSMLWARGFFQHEYGVLPSDVEWWIERSEQESHGSATGFTPPPEVRLNYMRADQSLGQMLVDGEVDAVYVYFSGGTINRSRVNLEQHPAVRRLFPDPAAEAVRYYRKTGIYPMNHTVVMRRSLYERHPWAARNIYEAFVEAKHRVYRLARQLDQHFIEAGLLSKESAEGLKTDLFPYGLSANRGTLDAAMLFSHEQGLTPRLMTLDELFAPTLLDT